jgi:hypothetical protein
MLRSKIKPRNEPIVFLDCGPTVLPNVLTESFLTNRLKDLFGEMAVRAVKEINAFGHGEVFRSLECGLITELARRVVETAGCSRTLSECQPQFSSERFVVEAAVSAALHL